MSKTTFDDILASARTLVSATWLSVSHIRAAKA